MSENAEEKEMVDRESNMMNETLVNLKDDEIVIVSNHKHPLYKVIDENLLCEGAKSGQCFSLENKSMQSEPTYFKCVKKK